MFLSRICMESKCVISGDISQTDIDFCNYESIIERLDGLDGVGIVELTIDDIQREGIVGKILTRLDKK